jgi:uncharacterized protein (TIGR00255 family)
MIRGMTGFGRSQGQASWGGWTWEVRSVNGKSLDMRMSLPPGFDPVEFEARRRIKDRLSRGNLQLQLKIDVPREASGSVVSTRELTRFARLARSFSRAGPAPASLDGLLALPGVIRTAPKGVTVVDEAMTATLLAGLEVALDELVQARVREGAMLEGLFRSMLMSIASGLSEARALAGVQGEMIAERFRLRLAELTGGGVTLDADRVLQEAALMAARADVREELDRLEAHIETFLTLLDAPDAAGRKLDFLCQELNREASTLCSKSASLDLTKVGLAFKSLIDQIREQVQNVE